MKISLVIYLLAGAIYQSPAQASSDTNSIAATVVTPEFLAHLIREADGNNPSLEAARSKVRAAGANTKSIPLFPDPNFIVGGMASERMMRMEDGDVTLGVEQELPLFGKAQAGRRAAQSETAITIAESRAEKVRLASEVSQAVLRVALADTLITIAAEDQQWQETLLSVAQERYRFGRATQVDVLRLQNDRGTQAERVKTEVATREREAATVNRLLNRYPLSYFPPLALPTNSIQLPQHDTLYLATLTNGPLIQILKNEVTKAEAQYRMVRAESRPDVMLGVESRQYARTPEWRSTDVMLKMSIPLANRSKYKKAQEREKHLKFSAEKILEDGRNELNEEVHHLMVQIDAAQREATLYANEIIPRTEQTLTNARAAWQNNTDSLRDVLDTRRMLLDARLMQARAQAEQWMRLAELAALCGFHDLNQIRLLHDSEKGMPTTSLQNR